MKKNSIYFTEKDHQALHRKVWLAHQKCSQNIFLTFRPVSFSAMEKEKK